MCSINHLPDSEKESTKAEKEDERGDGAKQHHETVLQGDGLATEMDNCILLSAVMRCAADAVLCITCTVSSPSMSFSSLGQSDIIMRIV